MELFLRNGDYVPNETGGFLRAAGGEELLQRVLFKLTARRGSFPLLPELGSRLFELTRHKESRWEMLARQFVTEALEDEEELAVEGVAVTPTEGGAAVEVTLDYRGETLRLTLEV